MLKIAVCDDNESFLETLKKIISESARDYFKDINVQCFNNGQRLLNQHKRLFFDVIFWILICLNSQALMLQKY